MALLPTPRKPTRLRRIASVWIEMPEVARMALLLIAVVVAAVLFG